MDLGVRGRNYVLVGGSRGMGWETAKVLAAEGANIALVSRSPGTVQPQAEALAARAAVRVICLGADVAEPSAVAQAIADAVDRLGPIRGLLVTNGSTSRNGSIIDMSEDDWRANIDDVLMGTVRSCRAIIPHMAALGGGQVVLTSALSARAAKPWLVGYAAMKAALINLTKNLAVRHGAEGIRVNCVCPGAIETERSKARVDAIVEESGLSRVEASKVLLRDRMNLQVALERIGQPSEVAEMMAFLLSERAAYTTGAIVNVDGGTDF